MLFAVTVDPQVLGFLVMGCVLGIIVVNRWDDIWEFIRGRASAQRKRKGGDPDEVPVIHRDEAVHGLLTAIDYAQQQGNPKCAESLSLQMQHLTCRRKAVNT